MAYRLAIDSMIGVKVAGKYFDASGAEKSFNFTLVCERLGAAEMQATVTNKEETVLAFFERVARDWRGQSLVLEDDDAPAAFSVDALRALLGIAGMANTCWGAYIAQIPAVAKN